MRVHIPEHNSVVDFPDDTPEDEIREVMESNFPAKAGSREPNGIRNADHSNDLKTQINETIARIQRNLGIV